ncbi:MAG: flagellar hook basal-body protein [Thermaerobacter sp.]|nr:flagellar hook basal-body protein [Thermaerobacter sp.]
MDIGLSIATSALTATQQGVSVYANDLVNSNTPAFSATAPIFAGLPAALQPNAALAANVKGASFQASIGQGVYLASEEPMSQSPVVVTGIPTDVAISGSGYFAVKTAAGVGYTRDGQFTVDASGNLVTQQGQPVLSTTGQPITVPLKDTQSVQIDAMGNVRAAGAQVAQIGIATFTNPQGLVAAGQNTFVAGPNSGAPTLGAAASGAALTPGAILGSSTDLSQTLVSMEDLSRSFALDAHAAQNASQMLAWAAQIA